MSGSPVPGTISVIIAAYNAAHWIPVTLESVQAQTYAAAEVLVIDDGSTDDTAQVVQSCRRGVRYVHQDHQGASSARNRGIRLAKGEFLAFVDADDRWHPRKLEAEILLARAGDLAWVICDASWIDSDGMDSRISVPPMQEGDVLEMLFMGNFIKSATPLVRHNVFDEVGYFNEEPGGHIGEDWDMWLRIAARHPLGVVREKLASIQLHPASMMARTPVQEKTQCLVRVIENAAAREPARLGPLRRQALGNIYHGAGVQLIRESRYGEARAYFLQELTCRTFSAEALVYAFVCLLGSAAQPILRTKNQIWRKEDRRR